MKKYVRQATAKREAAAEASKPETLPPTHQRVIAAHGRFTQSRMRETLAARKKVPAFRYAKTTSVGRTNPTGTTRTQKEKDLSPGLG